MALGEIGRQQGVGLGVQAGALEQVGGGGDDGLALVAVGDLAIGARGLLAHVGEQGRRQLRCRRRVARFRAVVGGIVDAG